MKKRYYIIVFCVVSALVIMFRMEWRTYYTFSDGKCFTVLFDADSNFIIPRKYTSIFKPKSGYIKVDHDAIVTIINDKVHTNKLIVLGRYGGYDLSRSGKDFIFYNDEVSSEYAKLYCDSVTYYNYNDIKSSFEYYYIDFPNDDIQCNIKTR